MSHIQMMYCYVIVTLILKFLLKYYFQNNFNFLGKTFPKIHHHTEQRTISSSTSDDDTNITDDDTSSLNGDYVFRIIIYTEEPLNNRWQWPLLTANSQSSLSPPVSASLPPSPMDAAVANDLHKSVSVRTSIASLCD